MTDNDVLMMFEEGTRQEMCQVTYRYDKANNKYMMDYDKNKESSFLIYDDANNLYGWSVFKKLPVSDFEWIEKDDISELDDDFMKSYDEDDDIGYYLEVDVEYPRKLHKLHSDLPFLTERMKINNCNNLVYNLNDKKKLSTAYISIEASTKSWIKT